MQFDFYNSLLKTIELETDFYKYFPEDYFPYPWIGHIPFIFYLIDLKKPSNIVELGTHAGCSYFAMCEAVKLAKLKSTCNAIDTWEGDLHAGLYSNLMFDLVNDFNSKHYSNFSKLHKMTFEEAIKNFNDESIDLLHIDGLHTYEAVRNDFESWLPKVKKNGLILFHDTAVHKKDFGVHKFWGEIKNDYPNIEFTHSFGLGVIQNCDKNSSSSLEFFNFKKSELELFLNRFSFFGTSFQQRFFFGTELKKILKKNRNS